MTARRFLCDLKMNDLRMILGCIISIEPAYINYGLKKFKCNITLSMSNRSMPIYKSIPFVLWTHCLCKLCDFNSDTMSFLKTF